MKLWDVVLLFGAVIVALAIMLSFTGSRIETLEQELYTTRQELSESKHAQTILRVQLEQYRYFEKE